METRLNLFVPQPLNATQQAWQQRYGKSGKKSEPILNMNRVNANR